MRLVIILVCLLHLLNTSQIVEAEDTLILKNGQRVTGKIVEQQEDYLVIEKWDMKMTYWLDQIEAVEKTMPAVIVRDEEHKAQVKKDLLERDVVDTIYDIKALRRKSETGTPHPQMDRQGLDAPGQPLGNQGIQFLSIDDDPQFRRKDDSELTPEELQRRRSAERFYNER